MFDKKIIQLKAKLLYFMCSNNVNLEIVFCIEK